MRATLVTLSEQENKKKKLKRTGRGHAGKVKRFKEDRKGLGEGSE